MLALRPHRAQCICCQALAKFVEKSLHGIPQRGQCGLSDAPHRADIHRRITVDELVAERHDLRQVRNAGCYGCVRFGWLAERALPVISNYRPTAAWAISLLA